MPIQTEEIVTKESYKIVVDYDQTLKKLIKLGRYRYVNKKVNSTLFPSSEKGKKEILTELICFNRPICSSDAIDDFGEMGLRPATITELLAFAATFPDKQGFPPVLALGSRGWISGGSHVAVIQAGFSGRALRLLPSTERWHIKDRFLTVHR